MQTREFHINLPKHLAVRIEDQVIERFGYKARGAITLLILEALEEKFNPKRSKTEKNGLALLEQKRTNLKKNLSIISDLLPNILKYSTKSSENNSKKTIGRGLLEKAIQERIGVVDKRPISQYIDMLVNSKILSDTTDFNERTGKMMTYEVNLSGNNNQIIFPQLPFEELVE